MANAYSTAFRQSKSFPKPDNTRSQRSSGLNPYTGNWDRTQVVHLLKRTMFGATKADVDYFLTKTMSDAVDELLAVPVAAPTGPLNNYNDANYTDPNVALGAEWGNAAYDGNANPKRRKSFKSWWIGLMLNQNRSIIEKMTLFWHNHFATETNTIGDARGAYKNNVLLRANALGNFKNFTKAVTKDAGMLRYLNGYLNTKNAPDENYARELMELFTIGKDPVQQYTQTDVEQAAKVLTGYRIDSANVVYYFDANKHDTSNKQFSPFFGNTAIAGQSGAAGENELDDLLNMIFAKDEVAEFICKKIYRFFVYYQIDATVEADIIQPLATIFRNNNYEILPVLSALFKSEHFFDALNRGCVIKSAIDFAIGSCREFNAVFPDSSNVVLQYYFWNVIESFAASCAQDIGDPPNVAGWPAYYQSPGYHEMWINSDTLPKRTQSVDSFISTGYTRMGFTLQFDVLAFTASLSSPSNPNLVISDTLTLFYSIDTDTTLFNYLKSILLSGQTTDSYWTSAWIDYENDPNNTTYAGIVKSRLQQMFQYLIALAEYQLS